MANKRIQKKLENRSRKKIHKILDLVLDINGVRATSQEITGYTPTSSFRFSGISGTIDVRTYEKGYGENEAVVEYEIPVGREPYQDKFSVEKSFDEVTKQLSKLKRRRKRDASFL